MDSETVNSRSAVAAALSSLLSSELSVSLYHIATPPAKTVPLFTPAPSKKPAPTTLESHFIAASYDSVLIFAIELLVYTLIQTGERIIFVSKADSSGYLPADAASYAPADSPESRVSLLRSIATIAVKVILDGARAASPNAKITISLFARSQAQYLFPNSVSNSTKHILTDRGLIAWWCRVLDPIFQNYTGENRKAYLLVPGSDRLQTRKLFPTRKDVDQAQWVCGHPLVTDPANDFTVREIIPHFPDDPKARFLDELNGDQSGKKANQRGKQWNNIRTVDDFWDMMSVRQECSLGRCVGFIWVVIEGGCNTKSVPEEQYSSPTIAQPTDTEKGGSVPPFSVAPAAQLVESPAEADSDSPPRSPKKRQLENASITMSPRKKKLKTLDIDNPMQKLPLVSSAIILDEKRYQRTIDSLLYHTDFGTLDLAKAGTRKWVQRSYAVVKASGVIRDGWDWGEVVTGTVPTVKKIQRDAAFSGAETPQVNVLQVRKKKPEEPVNTANVLSAGLIRKKPKDAY